MGLASCPGLRLVGLRAWAIFERMASASSIERTSQSEANASGSGVMAAPPGTEIGDRRPVSLGEMQGDDGLLRETVAQRFGRRQKPPEISAAAAERQHGGGSKRSLAE